MLPKVSIITVSFNSAKTIKETLDSVAKQSYKNIEHIIIDGASTDNTLQTINNYAHVAKVVSEKDQGIYDAMNKGIAMAEGEIIGILNSDDFYTNENVIETVVQQLNNTDADGVYADLNYVDFYDINKIIRRWKSGFYKIKDFYFGWMPPHPTLFVKKDVYAKCGCFNLQLSSSADYEFMLRAFVKHKLNFGYIQQATVHMRAGGKSNISLKNRLAANKEDREAWKINNLKPYFYTAYLKPLRKIFQFI